MNHHNSAASRLALKVTPWLSIWTASTITFVIGIQKSIYLTSTWPYITSVHGGATMDQMGWAIAIGSLGSAIANPCFGFWNQKTLSTKKPLTTGFICCAVGNFLYGLLPLAPINLFTSLLYFSRFLIGVGTGTLAIVRSFIATASTADDRVKAVSMGMAGYTLGFSLGPALQILFLPLGIAGFHLGPLVINTYTLATFSMVIVSILAIFFVNILLTEDYAGIVSDDEKKRMFCHFLIFHFGQLLFCIFLVGEDPFLVIPRFDRTAVFLLFFFWWIYSAMASFESLAAPITMAMYAWSSEEAVLYTGIAQTLNCIVNTATYVVIAATRIGKCDSRWHLAFGFLGFWSYAVIHLPWWFYEGPLNRTPLVNGTEMIKEGGCSWEYTWCEDTPRVPKSLYLFAFSVLLGFGFPLVSNPCNTLLSQILGPRKQGLLQGMFAFTASMSQFITPIVSSMVFEMTGYGYIMGYHATMLIICLGLLFFFRKRLVPLELTPPLGLATKYKSGTFYRM